MNSPEWHYLIRNGVKLACADYGGAGLPVVLLHGLAGYAGEWNDTAPLLSKSHRVVVPEQRGHGRSERHPADMSRTALVEDATMWMKELGLKEAVLVGHSLGGHTAFLMAARYPELVRGLVIAEATPAANPEAQRHVRTWLESWPIPFTSRAEAIAFFGGKSLKAETWVEGLQHRDDGFWPGFEAPVMLAALDEISQQSYWDEWAAIRCPVLVVRAERGASARDTQRMLELLPQTRLREIANAGHDLHLDQPERWRQILEEFLSTIDA